MTTPAAEYLTRTHLLTGLGQLVRVREAGIPVVAWLWHESGLPAVTWSGPPAGHGAPAPCRCLWSRTAGPGAMVPLMTTAVPLAGVAAWPVPRLRRGSPAPHP